MITVRRVAMRGSMGIAFRLGNKNVQTCMKMLLNRVFLVFILIRREHSYFCRAAVINLIDICIQLLRVFCNPKRLFYSRPVLYIYSS